MKEEYYSTRTLMRAQYVKRWHTVNTATTQTLAEHQWAVAIIAKRLCEEMKLADGLTSEIVMTALTHDISEIDTGDVPSPWKEHLKSRSVSTDEAREATTGDSSHDGPRGAPVTTRRDGDTVTDAPFGGMSVSGVRNLVLKAADLLEAHWWIEDNRVGQHGRQVVMNVFNRLKNFQRDIEVSKNPFKHKLADALVTLMSGYTNAK